MTQDEHREEFVAEAKSVMAAVLPGAVFMAPESSLSAQADAVQAVDPSDQRTAQDLMTQLLGELASADWAAKAPEEEDEGLFVHAAKPGVGSGLFGVRTAIVHFQGVADRG